MIRELTDGEWDEAADEFYGSGEPPTTTTSKEGNQPPSGLRGDPVVSRTSSDGTRDKSLQPHDLAPLTPTQGREEKCPDCNGTGTRMYAREVSDGCDTCNATGKVAAQPDPSRVPAPELRRLIEAVEANYNIGVVDAPRILSAALAFVKAYTASSLSGSSPERDALRKLTKESAAVLALGEEALREAIGHTNLAVFKLRITEAGDVLDHALSGSSQSQPEGWQDKEKA